MTKTPTIGPRMTIAALADAYCVARRLAPASARQVRWTVARFCDWAETQLDRPPRLPDLLDGLPDRWGDVLLAKYAQSTVSSRLKTVLALWRFAAKQGVVVPPGQQDARKIVREPAAPMPEPQGALTADSTLDELFAHYRLDRTITDATAEQIVIAYRNFAGWFATRYGRVPTIANLERREVHEWLDALATRLRPATVNSKRISLVGLWNYAADPPHELVKPPRKVKRLSVGVDPPTAWTLEQFERILTAARETPGEWEGVPAGLCWEAGLLVIWDTACRFNELFAARVADVDFDQGALFCPAMNRKGRRQGKVYPLHKQTLAAIRRTLDGRPPRVKLWPHPYRGDGRPREVWRHYGEILERAGLPNTRRHKFHAVRRASESHAARKMGAECAAEAVGHTVAVAKRHYLSPDIYRPAALIDVLPRPNEKSVVGWLASIFTRPKGKP